MTDDRAIRSIAVLGSGIVGLTAALAFGQALPRAEIVVIDTPPDPSALADRLSESLPWINPFHARLGIGELDLVAAGIATHRTGTRFDHWSADGSSWTHGYGDHGLRAGAIAFHQIWARARRAGQALPFDHYSAAAALARAGRFVHPEPDPTSPLSTYDYALRLDPARYRAFLAARVTARREAGSLRAVERRADGGLAALMLTNGCRIEADLFLDCAGPSAPLLTVLDDGFEDWSDCLPCDRLLLAEAIGPITTCDIVTAIDLGWRWGDRAHAGLAFASAISTEADAHAALGADGGELIAILPGRRPAPWVRNVLALGDAAVTLDPLEATNLHLAQSGIQRALDLLPGRDCHPLELAEYNRRSAQQALRVRDFLALHYLRSGRTAGAFWRTAGARPVPASLAFTLDQFATRGRLPFFEEETFERDSWLAVLLGLGIVPDHCQPTTDIVDPAQSDPAMRQLAERMAALPGHLPSYPDYLARMRAAAPRR